MFAVWLICTRQILCRVPVERHTANMLFAVVLFAVVSLPCVPDGKIFAVCFVAFAVCFLHTAYFGFPVVPKIYILMSFNYLII